MIKPTKRDCLIDFIMREFFDASPEFINYPKVQEDNQLVVKICDRIRQQYPDLAASAQSAEPWHITAPDQNGEYGVWAGKTKCIAEGLTLAQAQALVAKSPESAEPQEAEAWVKCKAERADDTWTTGEAATYRGFFELGYEAALARPSREEEMRTVLAEIERYARASLCDHRGGSPDVGSCPNCKSYLHIIELARAARAQGGARDDGEKR